MHKKHIWLPALLLLTVLLLPACKTTPPKEAAPHAALIGPYLQNMTPNSVVVAWATPAGSTAVTAADTLVRRVDRYEYHSTLLTGLLPDTEYSYDILQDGTNRGKGSFRTYPRGQVPFHFCVLGDTRTGHDVHRQIVHRIIAEHPLFVVNTGDLVANGNNIANWETFFDINRDLIRNVPYYTVLGNHEKDAKNYYDFFNLPGNERYYFFSVGDALFVVLDMEGPDLRAPDFLKGGSRELFWEEISKSYFVKEKAWLENLLSLNDDAGYIFVFFHPTWYSVKSSRVEEAARRRAFWGDIFERHHVSAVMNGHDHYYEHAYHDGTHYIVTAGGGAPLYDTDALQPETVKAEKVHHYLSIDVGEEQTLIRAIRTDGSLIEKIVIPRRNSPSGSPGFE